MRILVTGGAGFVGSHLCDSLIAEGHQVICLDSLFTGSEENIKHLLKRDDFKFIKHDIVTPIFFDDKIDQIYNLASPASPDHYQSNSVHTIKTSTLGVINMLGVARAHQARILQASTSEIYGDPLVHPQTEEYFGNVNPIGPRSCYDEGKRCAEALFFDYYRMHGMEIKVVRIFNTYGPRMAFNDGRVISNFVLQALKGEDITVDGDGSQTRSFCYVSDLVDSLIRMMNSDKKIQGPINLGNTNEFTMEKLADMVVRLSASDSRIKFTKQFRQDDPMRRQPNITKARKFLDWKPVIELEEGLNNTIKDFRNRMIV